MSNYPAEPETFPKKGSSGSGSMNAYSVEARYAYIEPRQVAGNLLDTRWRRIQFVETTPPFGVPNGRPYHSTWLGVTGLHGYQAAQALRWWFLAAAEAERSCLCIETRLIEHKLEYSYSETSIRAVCPIGDGESRTNIMPPADPPPIPAPVTSGDRDGCQCDACKQDGPHSSDCAVHNAPALSVGPCNCSNSSGIRNGEA